MTNAKPTIGQALDQVVGALSALEERERQIVIDTVCAHLGLTVPAVHASARFSPSKEPKQDVGHSDVKPALAARIPDIRSFKEEKQPDSARQMAAVVAFYLMEVVAEAERQQTVTTADLEKYFKQAGYKLPTKMEQVLVDSKKSGYFESVARGEYKLTRVGYNLVAHSLPKA